MNAKNVVYFGCFRIEHIPKEIRKFIGNKNKSKYNLSNLKFIVMFSINTVNLKKLKYYIFFKKIKSFFCLQ